MRRFACSVLLTLCAFFAFAQNEVPDLVPIPASLKTSQGHFTLRPATAIEVTTPDPAAKRVAGMLADQLFPATGFRTPVFTKRGSAKDAIQLALVNDPK